MAEGNEGVKREGYARRRLLLALPGLVCAPRAWADYPAVTRAQKLTFPRDHGAHPQHRTEWWYITGWMSDEHGGEFGVQVTFFRSRPGVQEDNPSAFAPKQLLFAHAALADTRLGRLRHDQRAAREGLGLAGADTSTTQVWIEDWSLQLTPEGYRAHIAARDFGMQLEFRPVQPILLEGDAGYSRKGPLPRQASYYYSWPHIAVEGTVAVQGSTLRATGQAWLDHEWSSEYLASEAAGWDWLGINLADGGALMAFRMRDEHGRDLWAGGTWRDASGRTRVFVPGDIRFQTLRTWRSPRTNAEYPVAMRVSAGPMTLRLDPLMPDQELDSRATTGTLYWEGAVRAFDEGREIGRGYLELTGYASALRL